MTACLHRKYIDLIRQTCSKFANWDPLVAIQVGAYGSVDKETGALCVEGNVYDPEFQEELDKHGVKISLKDFPPQEGPIEDDLIITSREAKRRDWDEEAAHVPGIAAAPIKGRWVFDRRGKRGAVLILHKPRQVSIPPNVVLEPLYQVDKLVGKVLVTNIHVCIGYSMYLSDKSSDTTSNQVSLALVPQVSAASAPDATVNGGGGHLAWWVDTPSGIICKGYDEIGKYAFTPLYAVKRPIRRVRRMFRDKIRPEPVGDELWYAESPPWDPLDEDGEEDPIDPVSAFLHSHPLSSYVAS